ncbi:MAG: hypothetical protein JXB48_01465 [Candidatus Latescibacteria bacterium]|nr:hypothetical protein [Candidatus Latescibacterota bacterium]
MHPVTIFICLIIAACGSGGVVIQNTDRVADVSTFKGTTVENFESAEKILKDYTVEFKIPNPLSGQGSSIRRFDPNHEDTILCYATLLDDISTEADIKYKCAKDSLNADACDSFKTKYIQENLKDGTFRIRVSMESGFSPKSMNPDHWVIYIENAKGIVIEPFDILTTPVTSHSDSIFSEYYRVNISRHLLYRDINLYFKRTTFFGEDLLGKSNPFLVLVFTHERKTLARVAWKTVSEKKK